tara:strand:- start:13833 stop:14393 length:561 start_codon:yes stop_codon:yes gene_type:complete
MLLVPQGKLSNFSDLNTVIGVFLLIVAVAGNFIAETLSCQSRKLLTENMFVKNIVIFMVIYFALDFTSDLNEHIHPKDLAIKSLIVWAFFLIFNKMDLKYTGLVFAGLFYILIVKNLIDYYTATDEEGNKEYIEKLNKSAKLTLIILSVLLIVGFSSYSIRQYNDHKKDFDIIKFILGKPKCDSFD